MRPVGHLQGRRIQCRSIHRTPLIGRVSMDTMTVDVSQVPQNLLVHTAWPARCAVPMSISR